MNRIAITKIRKNSKTFIAYIVLDEKRDFVDFHLYDMAERSILDSIYIARVENIVPNIHAAFVQLQKDQKCFLPLEDLKSPFFTHKQSQKKEISMGDELLVQVAKDAVKTKDPVGTTKLTLSGKHAVLTTDNRLLGVSRKLPEELRTHYEELLHSETNDVKERCFGLIIRTNAAKASDEEVREDVRSLISQFQTMVDTSMHKSAFSCVYQPPGGYVTRLKGTDESTVDLIYTDDAELFQELTRELPNFQEKIRFYEDPALSLSALYNIEGNLSGLTSNKVWLKSGANIIIETLETLTVIDVNTAKNLKKSEEALFQVNREAAVEIARQLRLRNISGMIIIDFINMTSPKQEEQLIEVIRQEIRKDPVPCSFMDITKLGLVELTRKKMYRSLAETLTAR